MRPADEERQERKGPAPAACAAQPLEQPHKSEEERDRRRTDAEIMADMLRAFRPARGMDVADAMMTTAELASTMAPTLRPDPNELARLLWRMGYRTVLTGGQFRWLMRREGGAEVTLLP